MKDITTIIEGFLKSKKLALLKSSWFLPENQEWLRPLRRQIALKILLFAGVPIIALSLYDMSQQTRRAVALAEDRLFLIAESERNLIAKELSDQAVSARRFGEDSQLQEYLAIWQGNGTAATLEAEQWLRKAIHRHFERYEVSQMWFIGGDGRLLISASRAPSSAGKGSENSNLVNIEFRPRRAANFSQEDFFEGVFAERKFQVRDLRYSPERQQNEIIFAVPVWNPVEPPSDARQPVGVWATVMEPENTIFPLLQTWPLPGETGETYLFRVEGGNDMFISPTRFRPAATLRLSVPSELAQKLAGEDNKENKFIMRDYRGEKTIAVALPVFRKNTRESLPLVWMLVAKQDRGEAIAATVGEQRVRSIFLMVLAFLGVVALSYSVEKRLAAKRFLVAYNYATSLINSVGSIIYAVDKKYCIQHVNQPLNAFNRPMSASPDITAKVIGKNILDTITVSGMRSVYQEALQDVFQGSRVSFARETEFGPSDQPSYWFTTISPLLVDGKIEGAVVTLSDVTERVRMESQIAERNRELKLLYEINSAITEVVDLDMILRRATEGACKAVGVAEAFLVRHDERTHELLGAVATSEEIEDFHRVRIAVDEPSLMWLAIRQRRTLASEDFRSDPRVNAPLVERMKSRAGVCVPLFFHSAIIGCLVVYETERTRKFTPEEITRLEEIGRQASIAIKHAELLKSYKESRDHLQYLMDNIEQLVFQVDVQGNVVFLNRAFDTIYAQPGDQWVGKKFESLFTVEDRAAANRDFTEALEGKNVKHELRALTANGVRLLAISCGPMHDAFGKIIGAQGRARDITEQRQMQEQLMQAQKMDSLGALAGGVAHDFNNMLTALSGHCALMLAESAPTDKWYNQLTTMETSIGRMADLTRQLLTFSRKTAGRIEAFNLNHIVKEVTTILQRTFGPHIQLEIAPATNLPLIEGDPSQINQVLMNLCLNARDALEVGGHLRIETSQVLLDEESVRKYPSLKPGPHVRLTVADNGSGIPPDVQHRIFEPFFTTKEQGKGIGLGLSVAYGIVNFHKGHIGFRSKPGETVFEVFWPALQRPKDKVAPPPPADPEGGNEQILVVDDEEMLLELGRRILESYGYRIITTSSPLQAVEIYRAQMDDIALVLSDVVMPKMNARELFTELKKINPNVKVLLTSGYSADGFVQGILQLGAVGFLQKPYRIKEMAALVRQALDRKE